MGSAAEVMIEAAEFWPVEPPQPPPFFYDVVGYMLHAGVDVAFGAGDRLPDRPPGPPEGIKCIFVCREDLERVRGLLSGFYGLETLREETAGGLVCRMFIHENACTWLAVFDEEARCSHKRLENPLIVAPDLTVNNPRLRERLLARPDREIHASMLQGLLETQRVDWSDVTYGTTKALLDAYEVTSDRRCLDKAVRVLDRMLEIEPPGLMPMVNLLRLYHLTSDARYLKPAARLVEQALAGEDFRLGEGGLLQAGTFMAPETLARRMLQAAGAGTISELVAGAYMPVMAVAKGLGREQELADLIATCLREHRRRCQDPETGLYFHGELGRQQRPKGVIGHGIMWTTFGLIHILEDFPVKHPARRELLLMLREACQAAARFQDAEGSFHHLIDLPWTPFARFYTSALAYVFLRGARTGFLPQEFREHGLAAWRATKTHVFQGGSLGADSGAPQSKRFEFYLMQPLTYNFRSTRLRSFWQMHAANEVLRRQGASWQNPVESAVDA